MNEQTAKFNPDLFFDPGDDCGILDRGKGLLDLQWVTGHRTKSTERKTMPTNLRLNEASRLHTDIQATRHEHGTLDVSSIDFRRS